MTKFKTVDSRVIHKDTWVTINHDHTILPTGEKSTYTYVDRIDGVFALIENQQQEILLIQQFRYAIKANSWEIPGGGIEPGESHEAAAVREIYEETGLTLDPQKLTSHLTLHAATGFLNNSEFIFHTHLSQSDFSQFGEANEIISQIKFFSLEECLSMISKQEITDACTIASLYKLAHLRQLSKKTSQNDFISQQAKRHP